MADIDWSKVGNTDPIPYLKQFVPPPKRPHNMSEDEWTAWSAQMDNARRIRDGEETA